MGASTKILTPTHSHATRKDLSFKATLDWSLQLPFYVHFSRKPKIEGKTKAHDKNKPYNRVNIEMETKTEFDNDTVYIKIWN